MLLNFNGKPYSKNAKLNVKPQFKEGVMLGPARVACIKVFQQLNA